MIAPIRPFDRDTLPGATAEAAASPPPNGEHAVPEARRFWLRVLFAFDILGAGGCGLLVLAAPDLARRWLFAESFTPDASGNVLGCIWIALGLLSIAGLVRPVTFSPVLLVQFAYKLTWLLAIALPSAVAGGAVPSVLALIFGGWVIAVGVTVPWRHLFVPASLPPEQQRSIIDHGAAPSQYARLSRQ